MRSPLSLALSLALTLATTSTLAQAQAQAQETEPAQVASAAPDDAPRAAPAAGGAPARAFIEQSLVLAPVQLGEFRLATMNDYPRNPASGVGVRYQHREFPEVRVDVFVYPAGRVDRERILSSEIEDVRASLQQAVDGGSYQNLVIGESKAFDLRQVDTDGSLRATGEPAGTAAAPDEGADDHGVLAALAGAQEAQGADVGQLLELTLDIQGEPMNSRAFVFYRGLYLFKGRISASAIELPGEVFERFTQHAMATLVPAIQVRSTGGCHQATVHVDTTKDGADGADSMLAQLIDASLRSVREQCEATLDTTVPEGFQAVRLEFDPAMWNGGG